MKLVNVYDVENHVTILWNLLLERTPEQSISHRGMPSMEDHVDFVRNKPYAKWRFIFRDNDSSAIGSVYVTKLGEIGIFLFKEFQGQGLGKMALKTAMTQGSLNCIVNHTDRPIANINPANTASIKLFESMGFKHIQNTYELTPEDRRNANS